jgi:hypothetical protein
MRKLCLVLLMLLPLAAGAAPAAADQAPKTSTVEVTYSLAFWDIPFGHMEYTDALTANSYSARAHFETGGIVGLFWRSVIDATADGELRANAVSPALYDSYSKYRDRPLQRVKLTFENDDPEIFTDPQIDLARYPVPKEQQKDTVDPMSALTSMLVGASADKGQPCGAGAQIFDGRRRYDVRFTYVKDEPLALDNGLKSANAHLCELHFLPIAGYPQKVTTRRHPPKMFADFIELPDPGTPNGRYVVPVKLWSEMSLGTVTATVDTIKLDGAPLPGMAGKS